MGDTTKQPEPEKITCEVCLKEVPKSEARSDEASDYVRYFCGLECYDQWQKDSAPGEASGKPHQA